MNNISTINWLIAIPLGFAGLFFLLLGFRRCVRFFDHQNNTNQKERFRDLFLSTFDIVAAIFCFLIATSSPKLWLVMIPIGLVLFIVCIPISLLGGYYQLYVVSGFMPKNAGIQIHFDLLVEKAKEKIPWYEFAPFAFILGCLVFFLVNVAILSFGWFIGNAQELYDSSIIIGIIIGTVTVAIVILGVIIRSKKGE